MSGRHADRQVTISPSPVLSLSQSLTLSKLLTSCIQHNRALITLVVEIEVRPSVCLEGFVKIDLRRLCPVQVNTHLRTSLCQQGRMLPNSVWVNGSLPRKPAPPQARSVALCFSSLTHSCFGTITTRVRTHPSDLVRRPLIRWGVVMLTALDLFLLGLPRTL